jgi:hypothetical protein
MEKTGPRRRFAFAFPRSFGVSYLWLTFVPLSLPPICVDYFSAIDSKPTTYLISQRVRFVLASGDPVAG